MPCEHSVAGFTVNDIQRKRSEPIKKDQVQKEHQQGQGSWPEGWVRLIVAELKDSRRDTNWQAVEEYLTLTRAMDWVKFSVADQVAEDSRKIPTWQPKKEDIAKAKQRKDQKRQEHREGQVELSMNTTELVRLRSW